MKIAFFVNPQTPDIEVVGELLAKHGYSIFKTVIPDEISQAGLQASKLVLVFDEAKFAYKFCGENPFGAEFQTLRILFLGRRPIQNEGVNQKLRSVGLTISSYGDEERLSNEILQFDTNSEPKVDLEFSITEDLEHVPAEEKTVEPRPAPEFKNKKSIVKRRAI